MTFTVQHDISGSPSRQTNVFLTCVAVSPSNFKLCALRERDNDGPNLVALRSNSRAAARFRNSTVAAHAECCINLMIIRMEKISICSSCEKIWKKWFFTEFAPEIMFVNAERACAFADAYPSRHLGPTMNKQKL